MTEPRLIRRAVDDTVVATDHASVVKMQDDAVVGYAESKRDGLLIGADELESGEVSGRISGDPPRGEDDTLVAANILVAALNAEGANWGAVTLSSDPADCEASSATDPPKRLLIQVVRATTDNEYWRRLARDGSATRAQSAELFATQLNDAIIHKATRYSVAARARLLLALDANRLPEFALTSVRQIAGHRTRDARLAAGFADVWVVGPTAELSYRLSD
jgi:hypothetical protein